MPLKQIEAPAAEPVTPDEVKASARIDADDTSFDTQLAIVIAAVRSHAEARTGRCLITQTLELILDGFPAGEINLLLPNVQSIETVKYIDAAGVEQTLASNRYALGEDGLSAEFSWLFPATGTDWPATADQANAVRIRFKVGYGDAGSDVPQDLRLWIIAHAVQIIMSPDGLADQQIKPMPFIDRLLDPYIVYRVA